MARNVAWLNRRSWNVPMTLPWNTPPRANAYSTSQKYPPAYAPNRTSTTAVAVLFFACGVAVQFHCRSFPRFVLGLAFGECIVF